MQHRGLVIGAFAVVYFVWGSTYLAIDLAIASIPPLWMAGTRFVIAGGALMAWGRLRGSRWPTAGDLGDSAVVGVLMLSLGNGALVIAETKMPIGVAALLIATVPMWMVGLEALGHRAWPRRGTTLGLAIGLVGVGLLSRVEAGWTGGRVDFAMVFLILFGALGWAAGSLLSRRSRLSSMRMRAGSQMLGGGLALLLMGLVSEPMPSPAAITAESLWSLAYLVVAGSVLAFTAYVWLLRTVSAAAVGTYAFVNPVVAMGLGAWWLMEPITGRSVLAALLIIGAVFVINRSEAGAGRVAPPGAFGASPEPESDMGPSTRS